MAEFRLSRKAKADLMQGKGVREKGSGTFTLEIWGVDAVDGSMVTLAGQMRCTDKGRWGVQREINRRVLERFRQLGIAIADPRERPLVSSSVTPGLQE